MGNGNMVLLNYQCAFKVCLSWRCRGGGKGDGWREPVCLVLIRSCWEGVGGDKGGENERIGSVLIEPKQRPTVRTRNTDL